MSEKKELIPEKGKKSADLKIHKSEKSDIPKDLQDKWSAVEAAATTANLLQKGSFPLSFHKALMAAIVFMQAIHQNCVEDCLKHPQAHLIPELKAELEKAAGNGEEKTQ